MAIEFIPAVCPKCGGELRVPNNVDVIKCMYCGADIILHDSSKINLKKVIDIEKFLALAERAIDAENFSEAYRYASLILEEDPFLRKALLVKGFAAGMCTTYHKSRIEEAEELIKLALGQESIDKSENNADRNKKLLEPITDLETKRIVYDYCLKIARHLSDLKYNLPSYVDSKIGDDYGYQIYKFRVMAYKISDDSNFYFSTVLPDRDALPNLIFLHIKFSLDEAISEYRKRLETAIKSEFLDVLLIYKKAMSWHADLLRSPLSGTDLLLVPTLQKVFQEYEIKVLEVEKEITSKKKDKCFIATATMGNINHPYVCTLRGYRDDVLATSKIGKKIVKLYYFLSPTIARVISKNRIFREISLRLIVLPAYKIATNASTRTETQDEI